MPTVWGVRGSDGLTSRGSLPVQASRKVLPPPSSRRYEGQCTAGYRPSPPMTISRRRSSPIGLVHAWDVSIQHRARRASGERGWRQSPSHVTIESMRRAHPAMLQRLHGSSTLVTGVNATASNRGPIDGAPKLPRTLASYHETQSGWIPPMRHLQTEGDGYKG